MGNTSVLSARMKSFEIPRYGHAGPVGRFSISLALRSGPQVKDRALPSSRTRTEKCLPQGSGDVRAATYPKMICQINLPAGAKRKWIPDHFLGFRLSLVARHVRAITSCPNLVLINARTHAMRVHARLALKWARLRAAFAEGTLLLESAWTQTTRMDGVAARFVVKSCPVESISVNVDVMKASVEPVRCQSMLDATVVKSRRLLFAANEMMN
jgi:hypothetical protein